MSYFFTIVLWIVLDLCFNFPIIAMIDLRNVAFQRLGKRERKSPGKYSLYKCTCTGGGGTTNWRLTIIMIIYLASISRREVKCETVTEISSLLWCQMSQFQLCHQTDTMKVIYKNTLTEKSAIFTSFYFRWDFYCFGRLLGSLWSSPMKVRIYLSLNKSTPLNLGGWNLACGLNPWPLSLLEVIPILDFETSEVIRGWKLILIHPFEIFSTASEARSCWQASFRSQRLLFFWSVDRVFYHWTNQMKYEIWNEAERQIWTNFEICQAWKLETKK